VAFKRTSETSVRFRKLPPSDDLRQWHYCSSARHCCRRRGSFDTRPSARPRGSTAFRCYDTPGLRQTRVSPTPPASTRFGAARQPLVVQLPRSIVRSVVHPVTRFTDIRADIRLHVVRGRLLPVRLLPGPDRRHRPLTLTTTAVWGGTVRSSRRLYVLDRRVRFCLMSGPPS